ncbi:uncharacterized protein [Nerophis lumbriciformis]|uniref:uncharacterized protein n=1 Tax=Nerophis lumbriciformis TaxID=546530 RepID=UPI003BAB808A
MGIATTRRLVLKKGAGPTIFNRPRPGISGSVTVSAPSARHQVTPEIQEGVRARPARVSEVPSSSVAAPSDSPEMQPNIATPGASGMQAKLRPPSVSGSSDDSYVPSGSSTSDPCQSDGSPDPTRTPKMREKGCHKEPKYIIFESCLQSLVKWCHCPACGSQDISPSWDLNVLNSIGVVTYVKSTFFNHQELILQPAIKKVWEEQQRTHLTMLQVEGRPLVLGGDWRADSPGHSAKFGTYTTMELEANVVLDLQVVQSNECHGSYHMEMEGLKRMVELLISWDLDVGVLVTDRHRQITTWIRENMPNTRHCYDIWHVAKSIGKKLKAIDKLKDCEDLKPWVLSIINHLYWAAVSTPPGEVGTSGCQVEVCGATHSEHPLPNLCSWTTARYKAAKEMSQTKFTLSSETGGGGQQQVPAERYSIAMLSGEHQTSKVKAFHSLIIQFAPKMYVFSYIGMLCRYVHPSIHFLPLIPFFGVAGGAGAHPSYNRAEGGVHPGQVATSSQGQHR